MVNEVLQYFVVVSCATSAMSHTFLRNSARGVRTSRFRYYSLHTQSAGALSSTSQGSVNHDEIAHFSKLSSQWWDEQGEFSFLHKMNPVRMQFIADKLLEVAYDEKPDTELERGQVLKGLDVLDVGCGGGLLSESLARMGANTLGIDASESNIAIASVHSSADPKLSSGSKQGSLTYLHSSAESLLPLPKRYDIVCSMEVLEHVDNPATFLSTCAELLKPGGHLFLSTISRTPLAYVLTILLAEDILRKVTSGTHTYSKFIKPTELVQFFREYRSPEKADPGADHSTLALPSVNPWISTSSSNTYLPRLQAELRGLIYNPLQARWLLAPRDAWGALECNYLFWVRKPKV
ncbi:ubiquinone biosynthesis O-methyltransferase [Phlegmacium glaucopus]|nr:ubiquinone biosynthesis O-methyltransferase [Phlegmacium glaucopus]